LLDIVALPAFEDEYQCRLIDFRDIELELKIWSHVHWAERVVATSAGKIEQVGTPMVVFGHPANAFIFEA
jgi:hypothetical protein